MLSSSLATAAATAVHSSSSASQDSSSRSPSRESCWTRCMASLPASQHPSGAALWLQVKHQVRYLQPASTRQHAGIHSTLCRLHTLQHKAALCDQHFERHSRCTNTALLTKKQVSSAQAPRVTASAASRRSSLGLRLQQQAWDGSSLISAPSEGERPHVVAGGRSQFFVLMGAATFFGL